MQGAEQFAVFGCDDEPTRAICAAEAARRAPGRAVCADIEALAARQAELALAAGPAQPAERRHRRARSRPSSGSTSEQIEAGLASFRGLPHRMECVGEIGGVDLRQRFQGDQSRVHRACAGRLSARPRAAHPLDRRRLAQGRRPRRVRARFRQRRRRLHHRRGGAAVRRLLEPHMPVQRCEMLCEAVSRALAAASRAMWCCSRPPAPASTSSAITRRAASLPPDRRRDRPAA